MTETKKQGVKKGAWKLQNSIWLILVFIPFVQWSAFFYIANRTDCKKLRIIGNVVLGADMSAILAAILSMIVRYKWEIILTNIFIILFLLIALFSIIAGIVCLMGYWKALESRSVRSDGIETITGRPQIWELKKTTWVLLGFVPLLFFTSFIVPAMKMKRKLYWGYFGVFGALFIAFVFCGLVLMNDIGEVMLMILFISHVFSLSLLMNIRAKYLKFIDSQEMHNAVAAGVLKLDSEEAPPYTELGASASLSASAPSISSSRTPLNINTCSEEELIALPGLNIIDAKKAISFREQNGDFESIEDFITVLHIKPHIAAPLYDYITVEPSVKVTSRRTSHSRKIDL